MAGLENQSVRRAAPVREQAARPSTQKLSLLNGLLIGLALVLGVWGWEAFRLATMPVPLRYPSLIFAGLFLVGLFGLVGWVSGRFESPLPVMLLWLVAAIVAALFIAYQPTFGRTLFIWLADRRFWGLPIYPYSFESLIPPTLAGFFIILALVLLALLQNYRLEAAGQEVDKAGRLQARAWFILLLPLPVVMITGMATRAIVGDPSAKALQLVLQAIPVAHSHEGDLFELGLQDGLNYSAFNSVRDQLTNGYTLGLGGIDSLASTTYVVTHFDNDAWVTCRIIGDTLSFCYDAAPPYTVGLASLITGEEPPETCRGCLPNASEELQSWLRSRGNNFAGEPEIRRVAQWGGHVLMRAEAGDYALECWFEGFSPVQLKSCTEAAP